MMEQKLAEHKQRVDDIVSQLQKRPEDKLVSIRKATMHHQIHDTSWKDKCHRVDVSKLDNILGFEYGKKDRLGNECTVIIAEGQVMMEQLAQSCLDRGLLPHCVPEYSNFTVAGLINGEGIQSSSFRYGVFSHTVVEIEVVLGDGSVVICNLDSNKDLFSHLPESMGTLGIVTMAKIACRRATPWVLSTYELFHKRGDFVQRINELCRTKEDDFMEGLVCSKDSYLVIRGKFAPAPPPNVPEFRPQPFDTTRGDPYYYQYVRYTVLQNNFQRLAIPQDAIPTLEFLFRSMRGAWWIIEMHINNRFLESLPSIRRKADVKVAAAMGQNAGFSATGKYMSRAQEERCTVFQDMGINLKRLDEGIAWVNEKLGVYPLWICPVDSSRSLKTKEHLHGAPTDDTVVDIGIYGEPTVQPYHHNRLMPALQKFVEYPSTWGMSHVCSKEELKAGRDPIRRRFNAIGVFPGIEDKILFPNLDNVDLDEEPITCWRLYRDHGKYWWIKVPAFLLCVLLILIALLWGVAKLGQLGFEKLQ